MTKKYFTLYAWFYLILNVAVILGGAFVRATGSGAGCGVYWPLCQGDVFPDLALRDTFIEFSHRVSSAAVGFGALFLVFGAFFLYPPKHLVRFASLAVVCFVIFEGLLGALLVIFGLVDSNASTERIWIMAFHLANTFLLLAAITITAVWSSGSATQKKLHFSRAAILGAICLLLLFITNITGGITALGDTIFKPEYVGQNFFDDLSSSAHVLQTLRAVHPFFAIFSCAVLAITITTAKWERSANCACMQYKKKFWGVCVLALIGIQIFIGMVNLLFLTPVVLQILHLFLADALWVATLLYFLRNFSKKNEI